MILNQVGGVDSYNDYYPFGMQMPGRNSTASADARYKYNGKELDAETNLSYYGRRYFDGWKAQWNQTDPMGSKYPATSPYAYVLDNPIRLVDPNGTVTYMVDGVEVDQELGEQMSEQYQQQMALQNNNGNKNQNQNNKDDNSKSKNNGRNQKDALITVNASAALSGAAGGNVEFGMLFNLNDFLKSPSFSLYYRWGYSIGFEAYAGFGINMYNSSMQDFLGTNTSSFANNPNWHEIQVGYGNITFDQTGVVGAGGGLGVGTGFGDNLTNQTEITIPFPLKYLFNPIFKLPFLR